MPDYIPPSDAEFDSWQTSGLAHLNANLDADVVATPQYVLVIWI